MTKIRRKSSAKEEVDSGKDVNNSSVYDGKEGNVDQDKISLPDR